jgi:hypothetical protein
MTPRARGSTAVTRRILALVLMASLLGGCGLWAKITGQERRAQETAQKLEEMRQTCQRFADNYVGRILEVTAPIVDRTGSPDTFNQLSYWQLTQVNSAYTVATGPSPILCHLDFVVLTSLSRMVVEDTLLELDGNLLSPLPAAYRELEQEAWTNVAEVLSEQQLRELRDLIESWRATHPEVKLVGFVHFAEFAEAAGINLETQAAPGSLFGLLGLDPLAGIDPAVRQIEQTRMLAERAIFYMQRMPYLLDLQTDRVIGMATLAPPVSRANESLERASTAMADFARFSGELPASFAREREALLRQLSSELLRQETELRALLGELQTTLATGSDTAAAVDSAIVALDRLLARFPASAPGETEAGRPFDITEYTQAASEFAGTARELKALVEALGTEGEPLAAAVVGGVEAGRDLVDYLFWRALLLGLLLLLAAFAAALAYRRLTRRTGITE